MSLLTNSAEGYTTSPTTVTTGNSGGGSGDAFGIVSVSTAGTLTAINTDHAHGSWCYNVTETTAANVSNIIWSGLSATSIAVRFYFKLNALPSLGASRLRLFAIRNGLGSPNVLTVDVLNTSNKFYVSVGNANVWTGASALTTGQWYRVEAEIVIGATGTGDGTARFRYYLLDSTTTVETAYSNTAANTGSTAISDVRFGKVDGNGYADLRLDDLAMQTGSSAPLGPYSAGSSTVSGPLLTASSLMLVGSGDAETVVTGVGPFTATSTMPAGSVTPNQSASGGVGRATSKLYPGTVGAAPAFTAQADPLNDPPRVILTVAAAAGTQVTVQRVDAQGNVVAVRSANPAALTSGGWLGFDYEAPFGQPVTYTATTDVSAPALSTTVELDVAQPWLIHPGIPSLSVPLEITDMPAPTRPTARGVYTVLGRKEAVVRSDGVRKARTFDLTVRTYTAAQENALNTLLDDDSVLLLQIADPRIYRPLYAWVSVGDMGGAPLATYAEGFYTWTLPCVESARPSGLLQAQRTWADLIATGATWASTMSTYASWRDLLTNTTVS